MCFLSWQENSVPHHQNQPIRSLHFVADAIKHDHNVSIVNNCESIHFDQKSCETATASTKSSFCFLTNGSLQQSSAPRFFGIATRRAPHSHGEPQATTHGRNQPHPSTVNTHRERGRRTHTKHHNPRTTEPSESNAIPAHTTQHHHTCQSDLRETVVKCATSGSAAQ